MSVLVLGATGFIGPRLIRKLIARGESVVGMDLNPAAVPFDGAPIGAPVVRGDITQFEDVMRAVLEFKPERVINLAYGLGAGEGNPHQVMLLDVLGMDNCFEAARLGGVRRVVYASSIAVSGLQSRFGDRLALLRSGTPAGDRSAGQVRDPQGGPEPAPGALHQLDRAGRRDQVQQAALAEGRQAGDRRRDVQRRVGGQSAAARVEVRARRVNCRRIGTCRRVGLSRT